MGNFTQSCRTRCQKHTALAAARSELAEEVRLRTHQQLLFIDLKAELQRVQEQLTDMHAPGPLL